MGWGSGQHSSACMDRNTHIGMTSKDLKGRLEPHKPILLGSATSSPSQFLWEVSARIKRTSILFNILLEKSHK